MRTASCHGEGPGGGLRVPEMEKNMGRGHAFEGKKSS